MVIGLVLILAVMVVGGAMIAGSGGGGKTIAISPTPSITGDVQQSLEAFHGKVVILDFWATWCVPCKAEIPGFIELQKKYGDRGLQIIGLSVDDSLNTAKKYATEMKMNYPVLLAEGKEDILKAYDPIPSIPVSIIIDRQGRIVTRHLGIASMDVFEKEISALF